MAGYLWRKLSEQEKREIEEDAKKLILEFGDSIANLPDLKEEVIERDADVREEADGEEGDEDFKKRMLDNAPDVKDDCIVGEKGGWVK